MLEHKWQVGQKLRVVHDIEKYGTDDDTVGITDTMVEMAGKIVVIDRVYQNVEWGYVYTIEGDTSRYWYEYKHFEPIPPPNNRKGVKL